MGITEQDRAGLDKSLKDLKLSTDVSVRGTRTMLLRECLQWQPGVPAWAGVHGAAWTGAPCSVPGHGTEGQTPHTLCHSALA